MNKEQVVAQAKGEAKNRVQWFLHHHLTNDEHQLRICSNKPYFFNFVGLYFFCWLISFILDQNIYARKVGFHNYRNIHINVINST